MAELPLVHLSDYEPVPDDLLKSVPEGLVRRQMIVPIALRNGRMTLAVPKTDGIVKPEGLQMIVHCPVDLVLAPVDEIIAFIKNHYEAPPEAAPAEASAEIEESGTVREPELESSESMATDELPALTVITPEPPQPLAPPPALFEPPKPQPFTPVKPPAPRAAPTVDEVPGCPLALRKVLSEAAFNRAREVLLERDGSRLRLRHRIRGVLVTDLQQTLSQEEAAEGFRWVAENGDAQSEGGVRWAEMRIEASLQGETYACRFALSETKAFAMLTIGLSTLRERSFDPVAWGMGPHQGRILESFLTRRQGVVLFCGIEGDDLVGTMHACLRPLVTPERHVIAVQGRREERLPGVEQLVSFGDMDLFSKHLQVAFRHGPDVVLANPLARRDHYDLCFNESLRGRLVLARSYAADTADAIVQIFAMGVEPYLVGSSLMGVVAQRTLRLNCQRCQEQENVGRDSVKDLGIPVAMQPPAFFRGRGCEACLGTGYDRETSIFEVLEFNEDVRARIQRDSRPEAIRALLRANGMMTLRQIAVHKAINGQTSLSEVLRATA